MASRQCNGRKYFAVMMPITQDKRDCKTFCFLFRIWLYEFVLRPWNSRMTIIARSIDCYEGQRKKIQGTQARRVMVHNDETTYTRDATKRHMCDRRMTCYQQRLKRILRHRTVNQFIRCWWPVIASTVGKKHRARQQRQWTVTGICFYTILFTYVMYFF